MRNKLFKICILCLLLISVVYAKEVDLNSRRYILYNLNDNEIIDSYNENERISVASLTKIMTVIVAIENIEDYNEKVVITKDMLSGIARDVVKVGFKENEELTYDDLLYGAILNSGADAVNALALSICPDMNSFLDKMNEKVKELGLENSHFSDAVGLYKDDNYSSAYDVAQILMYALKNEKFRKIFETKEYTLSNGKTVHRTIDGYNKKSNVDVSFIKGAKTGYISEAGYCLASIATIDGVDYLLVTLGADKTPNQLLDHLKEYKYFSENYSYQDVVNKTDKIIRLKTKYSKEPYVDIYYYKDIKKYLKNDFDKNKVRIKFTGVSEISYFDKKGLVIGNIDINYGNEVLDNYDVVNNTNLHFDYRPFYHENEKIFHYSFIGLWLLIAGLKNIKRRNY